MQCNINPQIKYKRQFWVCSNSIVEPLGSLRNQVVCTYEQGASRRVGEEYAW